MTKVSFIALLQMIGLLTWWDVYTNPVQGGEPYPLPLSQHQLKSPSSAKQENNTSKAGLSSWKAMMVSFFKQFKQKQPPLGSRGPLCPFSPGPLGTTDTIWSVRPLFLWRGEAEQIVLRNYETNEVLWQQRVTADARKLLYTSEIRQVSYDGAALQPGQVYIWELVNAAKLQKQITFAVMPESNRRKLMDDFSVSNQRVQTTTAVGWVTSGDQLQFSDGPGAHTALHWANYVSQQGLWSDALQVLYTTQNPPLEITQNLEELSNYLCDSTN